MHHSMENKQQKIGELIIQCLSIYTNTNLAIHLKNQSGIQLFF